MTVSCKIIKNAVTYDIGDFGLALLKHDIPPNIEKEDFTFQVAGRAGKIRMGTQYKERSFNIECLLMADDPTFDYHIKIAAIADLLDASSGPQYWVFGDISGKRFLAEYNGSISIDKMIFDGRLTIPLVCYFPFTETVTDVSSGWSYGQGYTYGMGLRYGDLYSKVITASPTSFIIYHAGGAPLPPQIVIAGQFTNLHLSDGKGNELIITRVNGISDTITIDCGDQGNVKVILNGTTNIYSQTNGVFFELSNGETTFTTTATGTINFTISFTPFRHRYIY
jgi:phage-related protein